MSMVYIYYYFRFRFNEYLMVTTFKASFVFQEILYSEIKPLLLKAHLQHRGDIILYSAAPKSVK